jgi:ABC-type xylose transport system permease subunit
MLKRFFVNKLHFSIRMNSDNLKGRKIRENLKLNFKSFQKCLRKKKLATLLYLGIHFHALNGLKGLAIICKIMATLLHCKKSLRLMKRRNFPLKIGRGKRL